LIATGKPPLNTIGERGEVMDPISRRQMLAATAGQQLCRGARNNNYQA
jgi:hypothetical protein